MAQRPISSFDLSGKVALVTGGASGIGTGIVAVHIDLADEASIVRGCAEVVSTYGTPWAGGWSVT